MATTFISQSWADESTFKKLKNIIEHLQIKNVYMYPSNIAGCMQDKTLENAMLLNIEQMHPKLAIKIIEKIPSSLMSADSVLSPKSMPPARTQ